MYLDILNCHNSLPRFGSFNQANHRAPCSSQSQQALGRADTFAVKGLGPLRARPLLLLSFSSIYLASALLAYLPHEALSLTLKPDDQLNFTFLGVLATLSDAVFLLKWASLWFLFGFFLFIFC